MCNRDNPEHIIPAYKRYLVRFVDEYEKYFAVVKAAECVVVDKTRHPEFLKFIANPTVPSNQLLFHDFLHKPLEYYNDLQTNLQMLLSQSRIDSLEYQDINRIINCLQVRLINN
jgi:cobalamin biosynthesis Co2+ chelatase CbiK